MCHRFSHEKFWWISRFGSLSHDEHYPMMNETEVYTAMTFREAPKRYDPMEPLCGTVSLGCSSITSQGVMETYAMRPLGPVWL